MFITKIKEESPSTNDHIFYMGKTNSPGKFSNLGREHISKEVFQNLLNNIFTEFYISFSDTYTNTMQIFVPNK